MEKTNEVAMNKAPELNRLSSTTDATAKAADLERAQRLARLALQRQKRQEQLAAQQQLLKKKKGAQTQSGERISMVRFEDDENKHDSPNRQAIVSQSTNAPIQKLFATRFNDVYPSMTNNEWMKVRNAFVAQYFGE